MDYLNGFFSAIGVVFLIYLVHHYIVKPKPTAKDYHCPIEGCNFSLEANDSWTANHFMQYHLQDHDKGENF